MPGTAPPVAPALDELMRPGVLVPAYQPIVDLSGGSVVAYEALARWPSLGDIDPEAVFDQAHDVGRVAELDWNYRLTALQTALDAGFSRDLTLFVNVEPTASPMRPPPAAAAVLAACRPRIRIMLEFTERGLFNDPAGLLRAVAEARDLGYGIALDDVGAEESALAMLPFVAPDVVKLDLSLIQQIPTAVRARVMTAVMAHAERTGCSVLAEGVETEAHLEQAVALGADFGQGWYFGRPATIPSLSCRGAQVPFGRSDESFPSTPFELVADHPALRVGRKALILALSRVVEEQAVQLSTPPVVLSTFQSAEHFTAATRRRYMAMAARSPFVAALGAGLSPVPAPGVRGGDLATNDRLRHEWTVVVIGDHYAGAVIARDLGDTGPDAERRFEFLVTHDRTMVLAAGRSMMSRVLPVPG